MLLGKLLFAGRIVGFALLELGLGGGQLGFGIGEFLFRFGELALGFGFLLVVGLLGIGQLFVGVRDERFPAGDALGVADGGQPVGHSVHRRLIFVRIIVVEVGVFGLDVTNGVIIGGQAAVRHEHDVVQHTVAGGGRLLIRGKVQRVLHQADHRVFGAGQAVGVVRKGQRRSEGDLLPVAHDVHHALVSGFGHPAVQKDQTVHVFRGVGVRVCRELLDPQNGGFVGAGPMALDVQILDGFHSGNALSGSDDINVVLRQAEGGQNAKVKNVLFDVVFLPCDPHAGCKADQAGQNHHAKRHDAEQRQKAAQVAFEIPKDVFTITVLHEITTRSAPPERDVR